MKNLLEIFGWYRKLIWFFNKKPMIKYNGFHCGLCGKWVNESFKVPTYDSDGEYWDTVGVCETCLGDKDNG